MTVLSAQSITARRNLPTTDEQFLGIDPWISKDKQVQGMSYGLGPAGYDIRIGKIDRKDVNGFPAQSYLVRPGSFVLLSSLERFKLPNDLIAYVHDKSSLARKGLALQNTVLEPGWYGYITLELSNHGPDVIRVLVGQPIAQVVFQLLDQPTIKPYKGKYQDQPDQPVHSILPPDEVIL